MNLYAFITIVQGAALLIYVSGNLFWGLRARQATKRELSAKDATLAAKDAQIAVLDAALKQQHVVVDQYRQLPASALEAHKLLEAIRNELVQELLQARERLATLQKEGRLSASAELWLGEALVANSHQGATDPAAEALATRVDQLVAALPHEIAQDHETADRLRRLARAFKETEGLRFLLS